MGPSQCRKLSNNFEVTYNIYQSRENCSFRLQDIVQTISQILQDGYKLNTPDVGCTSYKRYFLAFHEVTNAVISVPIISSNYAHTTYSTPPKNIVFSIKLVGHHFKQASSPCLSEQPSSRAPCIRRQTYESRKSF